MILRKQFLEHVGQTSPSPMLVEVARAEGSFFYTPEGKRYFDLVAGVSVSNVGHANPEVVRAVQEQAANYMHVMLVDEVGNVSYAHAKFGYDTVVPVIKTVNFTAEAYPNTSATIKLTYEDATSGVTEMRVSGDITDGTPESK